jgi:hypothetical protein
MAMGEGSEVDPNTLRAAAADLDEHAAEVAGHGETLDVSTVSPAGHGAIGEAIDAAVERGLRLVAHNLSSAVHKFYTDAATVMRKTAAATERSDAETSATFANLAHDPTVPVVPAARNDPPVHSRYPDGTPVHDGNQPGRIQGPDPAADGAPHTRVQWDTLNGRPYKAREYERGGVPVRDIDFTVPTFPNGRPRPGHRAPEQHRWIPNDPSNHAAGHKRGPGEPLVMP